jgi:hypothetical protein
MVADNRTRQPNFNKVEEDNMRGLAIVSGLAITSALSVTAYADCKHNYDHCNEVVIYVCSQRGLGTQDFLGGSDLGSQEQIALGKAADAGYNTNNCRKRPIRAQAH